MVKALEKAGFVFIRKRGSHIFLAKGETVVPVPRHREIKRATLMAIIIEAGLAKEEFLKLL